MASNFPTEIDNIPLFLDITSSDGDLIKQFEEYIAVNDFSNANKILNKIENADQKILSASRLNKLRDCIIALENFYQSDFSDYIKKAEENFISTVNNFGFKGEYSSSEPYQINNIVSYSEDGSYNLYIRISGNNITGKIPIDTTYWRIFTVKGDTGISVSENTTFYFDWSSSQFYSKNSIVSYDNQWWISLKDNSNSKPQSGSLDWELVMKAMQATYPVQRDQPINQQNGELWFEVL